MTASSWKQGVLTRVRGSVPLTSLAFVADNMVATMGLGRADPAADDHLSGANLEADLQYAQAVAASYLRQGPIGGRVAEIGPGGSAAVALHLIAQGCRSVDLIDRFQFSHSPARLSRVYREIIGSDPRLGKIFASCDDLAPHIRSFVGESAAAEVFFREHSGYDAIISCAVLEHLYDPIRAIEAMATALAPGGRLLHQVDFRDHGMFSAAGHHELTFLTIPSWLYPHMSRRRGRPNRVLIHQYRSALDRLGLEHQLLVTHLVGVGPIDPAPYDRLPAQLANEAERKVEEIRPRLASEFRKLPASDLAVSGLFIAATASQLAGSANGSGGVAGH